MRAGAINRRITFQRRDATLDGFGTEDANTWSDVFPCWARFATQQGREFERALQIHEDLDALIICRYCSELAVITEKDRIAYKGNYFDIRSIVNVNERNRELQFACTNQR